MNNNLRDAPNKNDQQSTAFEIIRNLIIEQKWAVYGRSRPLPRSFRI